MTTYAIWDKQDRQWLSPDYTDLEEANTALTQMILMGANCDRYLIRNKDYVPT